MAGRVKDGASARRRKRRGRTFSATRRNEPTGRKALEAGQVPGAAAASGLRAETVEGYNRHVNPYVVRALSAASLDIIETSREGARVWDADGTCYIDCATGAGIFNCGRRNPEIAARLKAALERADMGSWLSLMPERARLGKKLAEITPGRLQYSFFTCGGGEAVDTAIKLARGYTGKSRIVAMQNGYHGVTGFALPATGREVYKRPFEPLAPGFVHIPYNDLGALEDALDEDTAAVIMETVQGEGGIVVPDDEYLPGVRRLCDERSVLLILDEIQTGLGRTGKMFGCENWGVAPDIMCLAKALSGGMVPISAAIYTPEIADFFIANPFIHINSFGGTALACTAALAAIEYIEANDLPRHAAAMGERLRKGLREVAAGYPELAREVRGIGLMNGIEYCDESIGPRMSLQLKRSGVLSIYTFNNPRVVRIMPPLVITPAEVDAVVEAFDRAMAAVRAQGS